MAGAGALSGRVGRERQGAAQQRQHAQGDLGLSDSSSSENQDNLPPANASLSSRRTSHSLWTEPKKTIVLQALVDKPRQIMQNPSENQENKFD
jgi:hypothetical protein